MLVSEDYIDVWGEWVLLLVCVLVLLHPVIIPAVGTPRLTLALTFFSRLIIAIGRIGRSPSVGKIFVVLVFIVEFILILIELLVSVVLLIVLDSVVRRVVVLVGTLRRSFLCRSHSFTLTIHY